jgi:hypothetical protein
MPLDWGPMGKEKRDADAQYELDKQNRRKRRRGVEAVMALVQDRGLDGAVQAVASRWELEIPPHVDRAVAFVVDRRHVADEQMSARIEELSVQFELRPPALGSDKQGLEAFRASLRLRVIEVLATLAAGRLTVGAR